MVTVPVVSGFDDGGPVSPELVLVDPALRARLALHQSALHDAPVYANVDVAASTYVPTVPMDSGDDDSPVYPERVLVDPVVRVDLAMHESVPPEILERPHAEAAVAASTDVPDAQIVFGCDDSPIGLEPVLVEPALRAHLAGHVPRRSATRRLLMVVAAAVALSAAVGSGVLVGLLLSGDRVAVLGDATTPPRPPTAAATTAAEPSSPAVSTQPPISRARTPTAAPRAAPQAGVSGAPWSRLLVWAPVASATGYAVEITRNGESVYAATTSLPHVLVPKQWRHAGRNMTLSPGTYHWYVWPIFRNGATTRRSFAAVVASKLEISP
ncbi:MAG: hypothetical protein ACXVGQ_13905 [Mycobacteriaceae bacterium]